MISNLITYEKMLLIFFALGYVIAVYCYNLFFNKICNTVTRVICKFEQYIIHVFLLFLSEENRDY